MRGPDRRRQVPVDILEKVLEIQEDEQQVAEFKERLEFNMGKVGPESKFHCSLGLGVKVPGVGGEGQVVC